MEFSFTVNGEKMFYLVGLDILTILTVTCPGDILVQDFFRRFGPGDQLLKHREKNPKSTTPYTEKVTFNDILFVLLG